VARRCPAGLGLNRAAGRHRAWRASLDGRGGWIVACLCIIGWWYALLPKTLWYRSGIRKFFRYLGASLVRGRFSPVRTLLAGLALVGTSLAWQAGGDTWAAVLSAWVGMAVGGVTVWLVRIVGSVALGQEAMGFGEVTLMGMIGAFLGWQAALIVFFLAPFTGVVVAVSQWVLTRRHDIAYGPFLCLAAALLIVGWADIWPRWGLPVYSLGGLVPTMLLISLALLGGLLWGIQRCKRLLGIRREAGPGH
jgi:leader peptidase (prepilin peptidase) / N-methyltransferase